MYRKIGFWGMILVLGLFFGASNCVVAKEQGLVASYDFNEGSGEVAHDKSGNKNHGTIYGGATWVEGIRGSALKFDGVNDYVDCGNDESLNMTSAITVEAWIKFDSTATESGIIGKGDAVYSSGWILRIRQDILGFVVRKADNSGYFDIFDGTNIIDRKWHHVLGVFSRNKIKKYVDGHLEQEANTGQELLPSSNNLKIGYNRSKVAYFNGTIDEVRIYNCALSHEEVLKRYQSRWAHKEGVVKKSTDTSGVIKAGIYNPSGGKVIGAKGIYEGLKGKDKIEATYLSNFKLENLAKYDVVLIPCTKSTGKEEANWQEVLREYVRMGYGIVLMHDSCGYRSPIFLFPEISKGVGKTDSYIMVVKDNNHPLTKGLGKELKHAYWDHINLEKGPLGKVVIGDKEGHATVVVGEFGKGRVVTMGNIAGWSDKDKEEAPQRGELKLLENSIYWLTEKISKDTNLALASDVITLRSRIKDKRGDFEDTIDYWRYKLDVEIDILGFDVRSAVKGLSQSEKNILFKKRDKVRDNYKKDFIKLDNSISSMHQELDIALARGKITMDILKRIERDYYRKKESCFNELEKIKEDISGEISQMRAGIKHLMKPVSITSNERLWHKKNKFIRFFENFHGSHNPGLAEAMRYMKEMGVSAMLDLPTFARGFRAINVGMPAGTSREDYVEKVCRLAEKNNLQVISLFRLHQVKKDPHAVRKMKGLHYVDWANPETIKELKEKMKKQFDILNKYPSFVGFYMDEVAYTGGWSEVAKERFRMYLKEKYRLEELKQLGIKDVDAIVAPGPYERENNEVLWMEHREFVAKTFYGGMKEIIDYGYSLKKDIIMFPLISPGFALGLPFCCYISGISQLGDVFALDPYINGTQDEAFILDLGRSATSNPVLHVPGIPYDKSVERYKRDIAISYSHADGVYPFCFSWAWKHPAHKVPTLAKDSWWNKVAKGKRNPGLWKPGIWEPTVYNFDKMDKVEPYLIKTDNPSKIALLFSQRTSVLDNHGQKPFNLSVGRRYALNQMGIYSALAQSHIQIEPIYAEGISIAKLKKYKVLIIADTTSLAPEEIDVIRTWVKNGGRVIVTASTTIEDRWARKQNNYQLADVFGVKYKGTKKGLDRFKITKTTNILTIPNNIRYRPEYEYDVIETTTGKAVAHWSDNTPAVVLNTYGKGKSLFIGGRKIGLCFKGWGGKLQHFLHKEYDEGVREFFAEAVKGMLKDSGNRLPFKVTNCPEMVEVVMRVQSGRRMLHFLNYAEEEPVSGIEVEVVIPARKRLKVFYPVDNQDIKYSISRHNRIWFKIRDFDVHEMVVIQ